MLSLMAKKTVKRGRGRPRSNVQWEEIGVRFLPEEKRKLEAASRQVGKSQAEVIRRGTVLLAGAVARENMSELPDATD